MDLGFPLPVWQVAILGVISFFVGILAGFVGLALGTMRLPALLLLNVPPATAAGVNILVSTVSAFVGGYRHVRAGRVDWRLVGLMGIPAAIGSFVGGFASSTSVPDGALITVAGGFVVWQAVEFIIRLRSAPAGPSGDWPEGKASITPGQAAIEGLTGAVVGLVGGSVGLILGSVRLPVIIRFLRINPLVASGSNLVIGFIMGLVGFIGHGIKGEVDVGLLLVMGSTAMVGAYIGAHLAGKASINRLLQVMSLVLLVTGVLLIRDGISRLVG